MLATAAALVALGTSSALASTSSAGQVVDVVGNGSSVHLDHNTVTAGSIAFHVSTTVPASSGSGSQITMFKPKAGHTLAQVFADFGEEFSQDPATAAQGTRDLVRDAGFFGLADVTKGYGMTVTEALKPGTYYIFDAGLTPPTSPAGLTTLYVKSNYSAGTAAVPASQFTVQATSADRFIAPANWPHAGTLTFENVSDTIHFMNLVPVKPGTTDQQVQRYFNYPSSGPPPFALQGPSGGNDVVSPGGSLQLTYHLPAGTYVLLCFVADDVTGMPHAVMGMHKVVVLH